MNDSFLLFKIKRLCLYICGVEASLVSISNEKPIVWIVYMETKDDLHKKKSLWIVTITRTEGGRFLSAQLISSLTVVYDVSVLVQFDPTDHNTVALARGGGRCLITTNLSVDEGLRRPINSQVTD